MDNRPQLESHLNFRAATDPAFRKALLGNSTAVITKELGIQIPNGWEYDSDSLDITTANPQDEGARRWFRSKGVTRDGNGRIQSVWVEVAADTKDSCGPNVWIGVQLVVNMVKP